MIFQEHHREQIRTGEKTMTRRGWDDNQVTPGKTYRATRGGNVEQGMFVTREECDCFIRVTDVYEEQLGEITEEDANREGGYSREEFVEVWEEINGEWTPGVSVWVIEFEFAGSSDPREMAQTTITDGGWCG